MAHTVNPVIGELTTEVSETVGTMKSATVLINGFSARLQAGIDAALENGATADELAPLSTLKGDLDTTGNELAAAVAANPGTGGGTEPVPEASRRR